jgi:coproporphyrinogen III oxidase-like Fe-S oxidoreductase
MTATPGPDPLLLYLNVPFCSARCTFCRCVSAIPNRILLNRDLHEGYVQALVRGIRHWVPRLAERYRPIGINWGGGTPTLLTPAQMHAIGAAFGPQWTLGDGYFCVEATADSLTDETLAALRDLGVNRLSIGVESFTDETLRRMARRHDARQAQEAVERAYRFGFHRVNIDLIVGYPGETVDQTVRGVQRAVALSPPHLTTHIYSPVAGSVALRQVQVRPELAWDAGRYADGLPQVEEVLREAGYQNSEYFHWSRPPHDAAFVSLDHYFGCAGDTFGFGSGAYSFIAPRGCLATAHLPDYLSDPVTLHPGPVTLDLALEKALGCELGLNYAAMARMFGVSEETVIGHPVSRAIAALPGTRVSSDGIRIDQAEYARQYVLGVQQRVGAMRRP